MPTYICTETFVSIIDGVEQKVREGQVLDGGSPIVAAYPDHFELERGVEQATAAPGESRDVRFEGETATAQVKRD